jgi:hypothetical protein
MDMPAPIKANLLPYLWRDLLGKLRVTRELSPLTYAFEEGQTVALGQQARRAESLGLERRHRAAG